MASVEPDNVSNSDHPLPKSDVPASEQGLAHTDVMKRIRSELSQLITGDPLLCDLPTEVTLEEVSSQIALEYGQAMVVNVRRGDDQVLPVVVTQTATVLDLKHAIKRHFLLKQSREGGTMHISCVRLADISSSEHLTLYFHEGNTTFGVHKMKYHRSYPETKYVWKRHWLYFDGQKLTENNKKLKEYNIRNKDEVTFVKRLKER